MTSTAGLPALPERSIDIPYGNSRASQDNEDARLLKTPQQRTKPGHGGMKPLLLSENSMSEAHRSTPLTPPNRLSFQPPLYKSPSAAAGQPHKAGRLPFSGIKLLGPGTQQASGGDVFHDATDVPDTKLKNPDPAEPKESAPKSEAGALRQRGPQDGGSVQDTPRRYAALDQPSYQPPSRHSNLQKSWEACDSTEHLLGQEGTPSKSKPRRDGTSFYIVREKRTDHNGPPDEVLRLPFTQWIKGSVRAHFVAVIAELVGTFMFLWFAFAGANVANTGAKKSADSNANIADVGSSPIVQIYIAFSFGFSLLVNVWVFYRVSGGLFNPAVTLALVVTKAINWVRGLLLVAAQVLGAILASFLAKVMFPAHTDVRTTLSGDTSAAQGVFIETLLTAELVFTILMLAVEKHRATFLAPVGIGFTLFVIEIAGVFWTGGSVNPARSFGPCVVAGKFESYHWIYCKDRNPAKLRIGVTDSEQGLAHAAEHSSHVPFIDV